MSIQVVGRPPYFTDPRMNCDHATVPVVNFTLMFYDYRG